MSQDLMLFQRIYAKGSGVFMQEQRRSSYSYRSARRRRFSPVALIVASCHLCLFCFSIQGRGLLLQGLLFHGILLNGLLLYCQCQPIPRSLQGPHFHVRGTSKVLLLAESGTCKHWDSKMFAGCLPANNAAGAITGVSSSSILASLTLLRVSMVLIL